MIWERRSVGKWRDGREPAVARESQPRPAGLQAQRSGGETGVSAPAPSAAGEQPPPGAPVPARTCSSRPVSGVAEMFSRVAPLAFG